MISHQNLILRHCCHSPQPFDRSLFDPIQDYGWIKPKGGLWTSPVDSAWGWRDWCESEAFGDCSHHFDLEFAGTVLTIDSVAELTDMEWTKTTHISTPQFEKLMAKGIDAIHLTVRGQEETRFSYPYHLYGWDCETVLVMNVDSVKSASSMTIAAPNNLVTKPPGD